MLTKTDQEIVRWLGRIGAASADHVMERFAMSRSWAYERLSSLVRDGLLEQKTLLHRQPGLYLATAEGLRWTQQEHLSVYRVSPGSFRHANEIASVSVPLAGLLPEWRQLSERELRIAEGDELRLIASVKVGELPGGRPALHRPDLALVHRDKQVLAIEVELSVKAAPRLQAIARAYARARYITHVYYLTEPAPARALSRAITSVRAQDKITVLALDDLQGLIDVVGARSGHERP